MENEKALLKNIPITFEYKSEKFIGSFGKVMGAGNTSVFHLTIDRFYSGRLRYNEFLQKWVFDPTPKDEGWKELADYFEYYIIAWMDGPAAVDPFS